MRVVTRRGDTSELLSDYSPRPVRWQSIPSMGVTCGRVFVHVGYSWRWAASLGGLCDSRCAACFVRWCRMR